MVFFSRATEGYVRIAELFIRHSGIALMLLLAFAAGACLLGKKIPTSFLPDEDQGFFYANVQIAQCGFTATNRRGLPKN